MFEGKCGDILLQITEHRFVIKALKMFNLNRQICEEFYEVYNGVLPEYLVNNIFMYLLQLKMEFLLSDIYSEIIENIVRVQKLICIYGHRNTILYLHVWNNRCTKSF